MLRRWRVPLTIQWVVRLFIIFLVFFTAQRIATLFSFRPPGYKIMQLWPSFALGLRYDLRWISIILAPILLFSFVPRLAPFYSVAARRIWTTYLALLTTFTFIIFGADFGHFAYVSTRLNASAMNLLEDASTSFRMIWESYPIVWILIGMLLVIIFFARMYLRFYNQVLEVNIKQELPHRRNWYVVILLIFTFFISGTLSLRPLYWSDAFKLGDNFKSYLALNPMQNFLTTYNFRKPEASELLARQYLPATEKFLGMAPGQDGTISFERRVLPSSRGLESRPNVVLVICESFSMYKSSMSGNPLNTTPYFDSMCHQGIFFDHAFSPHFATARGVFAILTGIPDVQLSKFSSRVEESWHQRTIINDFEDYKKYYFIGGSSEFSNFRGLLENIKGLEIHEQDSYASKPVNVWGISDKDLFREATEIIGKKQQPFFAIIQTADNHRPFTIPAEDSAFLKVPVPDDTLALYGFNGQDEYRAFCYSDFAFRGFMENARKQAWFNNTIFVFTGDHGVAGNCKALYPDCWTDARLSDEHIPILFYAPKLLVPQQHPEPISQVDILPTLAGMIHIPYTNTTLGRDVLDPRKTLNGAFTIHHDEGKIGFVSDSFYFVKNIRFQQEQLYPLFFNQQMPNAKVQDSLKKKWSHLTTELYETARWMLVNNKPG